MADLSALRAKRERLVTEGRAVTDVLRRTEARAEQAIRESEAKGRDASQLRALMEGYRSDVRRLQQQVRDVDLEIQDAERPPIIQGGVGYSPQRRHGQGGWFG